MSLAEKALAIEWVLLDVDGVLTDGRLHYGPRGEELKIFHVHDGLAIKMAQRAGLKVGLLSGRRNEAVIARATELGLDEVLLGQSDKESAFAIFLRDQETEASRVAYIGDDLPDLVVLRDCGLSFAPSDAAREVRESVTHVLDRPGGHGAVREMFEILLEARNQWNSMVDLVTRSS